MSDDSGLPRGWAKARVDSLVRLVNGLAFKSTQWSNDGLPIIRIQNLNNSAAEFNHCSESLPDKFRVRNGDLLFAWSGTPGTSFGAHIWRGGDAWLNQHIFNVHFNRDCLDERFLRYAINQNLDNYIRQAHGGAGLAHITKGRFEESELIIAPFDEQRRIVAKIEELNSDLEAGVAALKRAKANLKRYRASVLKAAVEGNLTEAWRAEHPATESAAKLLERILAERRQKWEADQLANFAAAGKKLPKNWKSKYIEPSPPHGTDLCELPRGWCFATLGQLINGIEGGKSFKCLTRPAEPNEWGVIKVSAMTWGTFLEEEQKAIPPDADFDVHNEIKPNDLLLSRSNTSLLVGATVLVGECRPRLLLSDKSLRLDVSPIVNRVWLQRVLSSSVVRAQFSAMATGTSDSMRNISQSKIESALVPVPPLREQAIIADEIESRTSITDALSAQIEKELRRATRLHQTILKRAFEGRLVAQDPGDEPASALLARINSQREPKVARDSALTVKRRNTPREIFSRRASMISYTVRRLATHPSFGRTQLEKALHLIQCHLGVDMEFQFERYAAGPFDKEIYKMEGVARKRDWFTTRDRLKYGVTYHPGQKIGEMCKYAPGYLGAKQAEMDRLLDHIASMNTDDAELFATAYAAWNDLLIDGRSPDDEAIIAEVHGWHPDKLRFTPTIIRKRLDWMRANAYVPTGQGQRTLVVAQGKKLKSRRRARPRVEA